MSPDPRRNGPTLSLVVVSWNSATELPGMLDSVAHHLGEAPEVIVVDNDSSDDSASLARAHELRPVVVEQENLGYGAGCNAGVRAATGEVVVLLNPDILLVDDSLPALAREAAERDVILGPRLLNEDGTDQISAFPPVASAELAALAVWPGTLMPPPLRRRCEPWRQDEQVEVGWLSGACLAARRDLFLELGPFDERLHMYAEDIDLCLRAQRRGTPALFAPDIARIIHIGHRSAGKRFSDRGQRIKISTRAWAVRQNLGAPAAAFDWVLGLVLAATRAAGKAIARRDSGFERAYLRAALRRPTALRRSGQLTSPPEGD